MRFNFNNYSRIVGSRGKKNWFKWKVFMDEPGEKLDKIKSVEYRLHETFPNPVRVVDDRASKFSLTSAGWGTFQMYITIYLKDGVEEHTSYRLDLGKSWPSDAS